MQSSFGVQIPLDADPARKLSLDVFVGDHWHLAGPVHLLPFHELREAKFPRVLIPCMILGPRQPLDWTRGP